MANVAYIKIITFVCYSTLLYLKFLLLWAIVILADFILEFRFEFLWPFWLLLRSVYDSFKYQGLVNINVTQLSKSCEWTLPHMALNLFFFSLSLSGLLCIFYLYCTYIRHDLLLFHPCALAVFCCQHLCLGAICLAHRYVENIYQNIWLLILIRSTFVETRTLLVGTLIFNEYKRIECSYFIQIKECVYQLWCCGYYFYIWKQQCSCVTYVICHFT